MSFELYRRVPVENLYILPILLLSVILHEVAHGWMALRLGDPTARDAGRLTFNPLPHIDPVGSIIVPALIMFSGASFFLAWAKPVPVDPSNFRHPRRDDILVSAIGPVSNIVLAFVCAVIFGGTLNLLSPDADNTVTAASFFSGVFLNMLYVGIPMNIGLAVFNMIPIPPLDGSHVLASLLPQKFADAYRRVGMAGIFVLILLLRWEPVRVGFMDLRATLMIPFDFLIRVLS